ncbi:MAG: flagellar hook-associated protein FlgL [Pseudomonadales bacterium]
MAIRFSFLQGFDRGLQGILRVQAQTFETQSQISSGRRITSPSDDPVASARIIQVNQELSLVRQFVENADSVENRLNLAENQVQQVSTLLIRIRELTIQMDGLAMTQRDRQGIAAEVDTRLDELLNLANTRDVNGEYIFAGFQGGVQPFVRTQGGEFIYNGDDGQRLVQIASSTLIPISDSGKAIFLDIDSAQNLIEVSVDSGNTGTAAIIASSVSSQTNYDTNSYPNDYIIQYATGPNRYDVYTQASVLAGAPVLAFPSVADTGSPITIDANATPLAAPTNLGWQITVTGTPAAGDLFHINSSEKQGILTTIANLSAGMKNLTDSPADELLLDQLVADTLNNLDAAENNMSKLKSQIGARQNTLDSVRTLHEGVELVNQDVLSELRDLDYAEALSRLTLETFILEASQQSFARISNLSLFNFL